MHLVERVPSRVYLLYILGVEGQSKQGYLREDLRGMCFRLDSGER